MPQVTDQETLAGNVRAAKARRRVSDAEIATAIGMSRSALNDRLNGRAKFRVDELQTIAAFLQVPLEQLLEPEPTEATA